jgi:Uma2 family endonuclease
MATATLITSEEFQARPDEFDQSGNRIKEELIGGEIVQMGATSKQHDWRKNRIARILSRCLDTAPQLGMDIFVEIAFEVSVQDILIPDVAVLRTDRLAGPERIVKGAPEIAIEVISPTDTASGLRKRIKAYLENGSQSVWIFYDDGSMMLHTGLQVRLLEDSLLLEDSCCRVSPCLFPRFSKPETQVDRARCRLLVIRFDPVETDPFVHRQSLMHYRHRVAQHLAVTGGACFADDPFEQCQADTAAAELGPYIQPLRFAAVGVNTAQCHAPSSACIRKRQGQPAAGRRIRTR